MTCIMVPSSCRFERFSTTCKFVWACAVVAVGSTRQRIKGVGLRKLPRQVYRFGQLFEASPLGHEELGIDDHLQLSPCCCCWGLARSHNYTKGFSSLVARLAVKTTFTAQPRANSKIVVDNK
jgi:hypothetical protein